MARFLIVEARFYDHLNDMLVDGARAALKNAGHDVDVITVPGALEIPGAISLADQADLYDGYVAIGVVIRGETYHFEIVAGESARGIMALTMDGIAIGNRILNRVERLLLIVTQETQLVLGYKSIAFFRILPPCCLVIIGQLSCDDVILSNPFADEPVGIGLELPEALDGAR